jgi:hypothetical protein
MKTQPTRIKQLLAAGVLAAIAAAGVTTTATAKDNGKIKADKMIGVPATMTRAAGNIRGIDGGGLPWGIGEAEVSVKASGKVEVEFQDLVFVAGDNTGKNTIPSMAVVVSCLDADNHPVNVKSDPFPVTVATATDPGGDGEFEGRLTLPSPCFAPIVMITNATGAAWFAVDGL